MNLSSHLHSQVRLFAGLDASNSYRKMNKALNINLNSLPRERPIGSFEWFMAQKALDWMLIIKRIYSTTISFERDFEVYQDSIKLIEGGVYKMNRQVQTILAMLFFSGNLYASDLSDHFLASFSYTCFEKTEDNQGFLSKSQSSIYMSMKTDDEFFYVEPHQITSNGKMTTKEDIRTYRFPILKDLYFQDLRIDTSTYEQKIYHGSQHKIYFNKEGELQAQQEVARLICIRSLDDLHVLESSYQRKDL